MASLGHLAIAAAAGRAYADATPGVSPWRAALALAAVSFAPDLDVIAFRLGVPYEAPWGHRGASHSLAAALALGVLAGLLARASRLPARRTALYAAAVAASHGLLDALTDGGLGVALLWPLSDARCFAPWQPIPVAPIGRAFLSPRGAAILAVELLYFLPLLAWSLRPRPHRAADESR